LPFVVPAASRFRVNVEDYDGGMGEDYGVEVISMPNGDCAKYAVIMAMDKRGVAPADAWQAVQPLEGSGMVQ